MPFPNRDETPIGQLLDLDDERRGKKPWLPQNNGADVRDGLVTLRAFPNLEGLFPVCLCHGAMLSMAAEGHIWRCGEQRCGVGALYRRR